MNKYVIAILMLGTTFLSSGCKESESKEEEKEVVSAVDSFRNVVMDLHNEEMGKMGQMMQFERQLKELMAGVDSAANPTKYQELNAGIMALDSGSFSMKSWMRNWSEPDTLASVEEQMKGLEFQNDFMKTTSQLMTKGIEMADKLMIDYATNE